MDPEIDPRIEPRIEPGIDPGLIGDCVHCGFCLPACPTYVLWGEEMDSPRGRIHLMGQHVAGTPVTGEMAGHFDACLGCMACVTACPSGVRYDRLIEQTRAVVEREHVRAPADRAVRELVLRLFPYPRRLRAMRLPLRLGAGLRRRIAPALERVSPSLAAMADLAPDPVRHRRRAAPGSGRSAGAGPRSACSPDACRGSSFPRSTRPRPGCWRWRAARW